VGVVSGFESGVRAGQGIGAASIGNWRRGYGAEERSTWQRLGGSILAVLRLVIPVTLLMALGATSVAYADQSANVLGQNWLTLGLASLPLTFLAIHLTNRRYGAGYAFWQVVLAWALSYAAIVYAPGLGFRPSSLVLTREVAGYALALFLAQLFAILVFDRMRGPRWWQAPLLASLLGGAVLCLVAFPAAYAGTEIDWPSRMLDYFTLTSIAALLMIVPYWMMRGLVQPKPGFGGY
jgi:uncharacterized PurR-regulated membrane protein YhhQ (DUF165 family)